MQNLIRTKWAAVGAALAVTLGAGGVSLTQAAISTGEKPVTVTVDAARILDTRTGIGLAAAPFVDATPQDLKVTGVVPFDNAGTPGTKEVVPADAVAVLVNVTVVNPSSNGYLSLRAGGAAGVPTTSTVNFQAGVNTPNAATVDLSGDGKIQVYLDTFTAGGTAHVLLDVVGYTVDHNHDDRYYQKSEVDAMMPVNAFAGGDQQQSVATSQLIIIGTNPGVSVRSVTLTAPTAGKVVVNASFGAVGTEGGGQATTGRCSISTASNALDSTALHSFTVGDAASTTVSLTRGFDVAAGATTFYLVCATNGTIIPINSYSMDVIDSQLTATFAPN